jgi:DNA-binding LytR/AlgR family response regulator
MQTQWRCVIVDDEPLASELIRSYVETVPELKITGVFNNGLDALTFLRVNQVDLLFLDIQMPRLTGMELIRALPNAPVIIITTAFREYAAEGFDLDVVDYLVKPVTLDRFLRAVGKVIGQPRDASPEIQEAAYIFYKVDRQMVKVYLRDILWIESMKDYIRLFLSNGTSMLTLQRIGYAEEDLPAHLFIRIHRSFIVARDKVTAFGPSSVFVGQKELPIGKLYKQSVQSSFGTRYSSSHRRIPPGR